MPSGRGEEGAAHPRNAKQEDLHNVEVLDEEEGGWAGHHEEVDYSKVGDTLTGGCGVCNEGLTVGSCVL